MGTPGGKFAQLGADDVIRFLDAEHFLDELDGNLGRGRAIVRSRRSFEVGQKLEVAVESPNVDWKVPCEARVVVIRDGFVGLELLNFSALKPQLEELADAAEEDLEQVPAEKTVIAPMPELAALSSAAASPTVSEPPPSDPPATEDETGDVDQAGGPPAPRAAPTRRRRPRPIAQEAPVAPSRRDLRGSPHRRPEPPRADPSSQDGELEAPTPIAPSTLREGFSAEARTDPAGRSLAREPSDAEVTSQGLPALEVKPTRPATEVPVLRTPPPRSTSAVTSPLSGTPPPLLEADDLVLVKEGTQVARLKLTPEDPAEPKPPEGDDDAASAAERAPPPPRDGTIPGEAPDLPANETVAVDLSLTAALADPAEAPTRAPDEDEDEAGPADDPTSASEADSLLDLELAPPPLDDLEDADEDEAPGADGPADIATSASEAVPEPDAPSRPPSVADDLEVAPPPAPPPAPSVPLANAEALEDKHPALPRVTRGGVLRVPDAATLLGLYLAQVRHGRLTVLGPLEGEPGDEVSVKIVGGTVVSLPARIVARVGEWLTLEVPDPGPMQEVLQDAADDWKDALPGGAPAPAAAPQVIAPAAPEPAPVVLTPAPPAAAEPSRPPEPGPAVVTPPPPPEPAKEPQPEDDGPPEVPRLAGDRVVFRRKKDLAHELKSNLQSGGLFVEAAPLPIRTKRQLVVQVGDKSWGVELQADVVFADGGRVGFSVVNAADAVATLEELLERGGPDAASEPPTPFEDEASQPPQETRSLSADGEAYIGTLRPPMRDQDLLGLPERRIEDLSGVMKTTSLQLVEHVVSHRWKGVLKLESSGQEVTAWFHEGSVAFVVSKPHDEASSVGRILINQKKLNEAGLREALETARASKKSLGRALVALGLIKKSDLSTALREQMRMKLDEALVFERGSFEWTPWREPPGDADLVLTKGVGILAHHLRHRFDAMNLQELEDMFGKNLDRPVGHDDLLDQSTQGMHLQPKELRFLQLQLDGHHSITDAVRGSPVGRLASLRLVALGLALGVLHFTVGGRAPREATRIGAAPSRFDVAEKDLQDTLHLLEGMNHFEVLGVHWSAHHRSYKEAYDKAKKQYDKGRTLKDAPKEVRAIARKITERIEEAFKVLNDTTQRVLYRKHLFDATERQYAADMLVKQGEVALMRGDRMGAMEALETAVELDPTQRNRQLLTTAREGRR